MSVSRTGWAEASTAAERFAIACEWVRRHLPGPLSRWIPANLIGFCALNLCTFSLDMALLTLLYRGAGLPNPVAISISYGTALTLAYLLNRWLNFRSHAPVGPQAASYVAVVAANYFVLILGVGSGLTALGVQFQLARLLAGLCEAAWMYCAMRWIVFRDTRRS